MRGVVRIFPFWPRRDGAGVDECGDFELEGQVCQQLSSVNITRSA